MPWFHIYNLFKCHFKPNQKCQQDMNDPVFQRMYTHQLLITHGWFSEKHFNSFDSLPIGIKKQMISHFEHLLAPLLAKVTSQIKTFNTIQGVSCLVDIFDLA